ncbi:type I glyceraldehyde-3-phosphate dehydrogenase [Dolosigranulum pigrum]|jgi:glyceraldehyde-3-phosphate dehydrogenase, type I|uniref:Glyceraldehyde-3-phosphate dehydrogenase n=3 Tax=Dolosigranulum TaxID=29393 RepID=H3NBS5_9LACT|nr:type I glyceraldehyde-3-phosphate dehydrogenase [Dolosigranulum pigrum]EHR35158.1 glyceraldehyde-3-phosphate dehydrogenase, type I [Dolosigranulum pigrum ATCC 51524]OOL80597.1 type I glyceraldehyde-3-phosphate dehydrogenase [Dolosigranulum pigrum]QDO91123.1 type I glyceraldehyde-3-phosphate dehydrogenase [Dolosigranulum pigrum]QJS96815.1 type I glyceraldehyde-3-phosphate dehydrogenase [Dolosigranulum pigrum]QJS97968.1 type I glyceraldehyde-3-phosphate dehydrogenase [Dolosigranulum pigrum]
MSKKIAINGFGRIGRLALRRILESSNELEVVAINDLTDIDDLGYLLKYDTAQGRFPYDVEVKSDALLVDGKEVKAYSEKNPADLPWGDLDVDVVLECTGIFNTNEKASAHLEAGAKKVLISAPAKDDVTKMVVFGVNDDVIEADDKIVSAASCTTNCLAPMAKVLNDEFGLNGALMSTIHAYTATQALQDAPGGRKNRAGAANAIPASTGAAIAVGEVIPEIKGRIDGTAVRVPTITGSMTEVYATLNKTVTEEEVNEAMKAAQRPSFEYNTDEIVSSDIIGNPAGSVFDATQTKVIDGENGQVVKVVAWYDNEYGFTGNMVRTLERLATV